MGRTFKRKMSSARICQSGDLLHFTHCVGRAGGRTYTCLEEETQRRGRSRVNRADIDSPGSVGRPF